MIPQLLRKTLWCLSRLPSLSYRWGNREWGGDEANKRKWQKPASLLGVHVYNGWSNAHLVQTYCVPCPQQDNGNRDRNQWPLHLCRCSGETCLSGSHQPWNQKSKFRCKGVSASSFHTISSCSFTSLCLWSLQASTKAFCWAPLSKHSQKLFTDRATQGGWLRLSPELGASVSGKQIE